ncbi:MAG: hypothetical protein K2X35_07425 [Bryobacteraceae bacterium]|nr:hypothetical protein [Bryobacteraceae bacterium]
MANLTIKNLPDDVYERLKESAQERRQSLNGFLVSLLIEQAPRLRKNDVESVLRRVRQLREEAGPMPETGSELLRRIRDDEAL